MEDLEDLGIYLVVFEVFFYYCGESKKELFLKMFFGGKSIIRIYLVGMQFCQIEKGDCFKVSFFL